MANGAMLALTALAALLLSTALVLAPLFAWQTTGVTLVIESSSLDVLPGVPFASEDAAALAASLAGRLSPAVSTDLLPLKDFETAEAMRDRLHGFCVKMPLRPRDSMIAYVRGQCLVPPPLLDADGNERPDPLGGHACLVAIDATLRGEGLRELVPIRDIVESIGSAPSLTTLVAVDLGNLRWDPRVGVLCGLVPRHLDRDLEGPPLRANGQNWVIASHDTLQYSGASGPAKRSFFSAALEQGLAGAADEAPWGDGDRIVELHELAPFVVTWTWEWSQQASGGRAAQRPAVWKLGVGRVELRDIPRDIRLVRVAPTKGIGAVATLRKLFRLPPALPQTPSAAVPAAAATATPPQMTVPTVTAPTVTAPTLPSPTVSVPTVTPPTPTAADVVAPQVPAIVGVPPDPSPTPTALPAGAAGATAAPAATSLPASPAPSATVTPTATTPTPPSAQPIAAPTPPKGAAPAEPAAPKPTDPWELLKTLTTRIGPPPESVPQPSLVDFAPHLWRQAATFIAATTTDVALDGRDGERSRAALERFMAAMAVADTPATAAARRGAGSPEAESLAAARRQARTSGLAQDWANAPRRFQTAIATRNDAVELAVSTIDVVGRLSGGSGPPFIDPSLIEGFVSRISDLSDAIASASTTVDGGGDPSRLDPLTTATQSLLAQSSWVRSLGEQLFAGITAEAGVASRIPLHERAILLRSRLADPSQRALLFSPASVAEITTAEDRANEPALTLTVNGRPPLPPSGPAVVDRVAWKNCVALASSLVDLVESTGIRPGSTTDRAPTTLQPILDELVAARRAIALLDNTASDEAAASEAAARLGARLTRLYERTAVTVSRLPDASDAAPSGLDSERLGGLLRIIDPRDAALVGERVMAGVPRRNAGGRYGLRVESVDAAPPRLGVAMPIKVSVGDAGRIPVAASLAFGFDPAEVAVRLPDGTKLAEGVPVPVNDLPWRSGVLEVQVVPLRRVNAAGRGGTTLLSASLAVDEYVEKARCPLPLPSERGVIVAVRGAPGTVAGRVGDDGWVRASRSSPAVRAAPADESTTAHVVLRGIPSRVTTWQMALEAVAGDSRKVDVELHAVPGSSASPSPDDRERAWLDAEAALLAGRLSARPLARATGVVLGSAGRLAPLVLAADEAATPKPADDGATPSAAATPPPGQLPPPAATTTTEGREVGPDLALVVRDAQSPGARPTITRVSFEARHPRDVIVPVARYDERARTITVALETLGGDAALLPADGTTVTLREPEVDSPSSAPSAAVRAIVVRKPQAVLTPTAPTGEVVASWNGPDQGTAVLSIDVDGYPRAFNFAVECSAASHLRPQGPHYDWRRVRIVEPAAGRTLLRAPAASIPMRLAVDAPADTFLGGASVGGSVAIVLRQIGAGLGDRGEERTVWLASHARQVRFTLAPPPAGAALAIRTAVDDWTIAASGEGFANVDVSAEARLLIAGASSPIVDSRLIVFDGRAPVLDVPSVVRATVGRPLVIPLAAADDASDGSLIPPERRRPGVSGLKSVEWAIDVEGKGTPKEWQPAVRLDGTNYELRLDTAKLPFGTRLPILVRATDSVGLSDPPARIWLDVAAEAASVLNSLTGKVVLSGRGEPDIPVRLDGPGGERTARTEAGGVFRFDDLTPGEYKVSVQAVVRNRTRKAEPATVTVEAAPAPAATVTIDLK
ncbi:MAG: hypothetical protein ACKO9B_07165 [Planctomycetota bacterium]